MLSRNTNLPAPTRLVLILFINKTFLTFLAKRSSLESFVNVNAALERTIGWSLGHLRILFKLSLSQAVTVDVPA
jgi:hypothetical protein